MSPPSALAEQTPDSAPNDAQDIDRLARAIGISPCPAILGRFSAEMHQPEPANRKLVAFGLLMQQIAAFRSGGGVFPDWESGEKFVLDTLAITPEEIIAIAREPEHEAK